MDFRWRTPGGPGLSQEAANSMAGYVPNGGMAGYRPNAPYQAQQPGMNNTPQNFEAQAQGAMMSQFDALRSELASNTARIAELRQQAAQIEGQIKGAGTERDALDMKLAANRASIGDIGSAISHQNMISTRAQQERANELEKARQGKTEVKAVEEKLEDAFMQRAWAENGEQKQAAEMKITRLKKEYKALTGKDYTGDVVTNTGAPKSGARAETLEIAYGKYRNSLDRFGHPTQAAVDEFLKDAEGLPYNQKLQERIDEVRNVTTQEKAKAAGAKTKRLENAAIEEAKKNYSSYNLAGKGSYTYTASNGKRVTVTLSGNGQILFECGKTKGTATYDRI